MTSIFLGGAIGTALARPLCEAAGWPAIILVGGVLPVIALVAFVCREPERV